MRTNCPWPTRPPRSDVYIAKAMAACHNGRGWKRYIKQARTWARREEFEQSFERAQAALRKAARV